jgi:hypothetical protein
LSKPPHEFGLATIVHHDFNLALGCATIAGVPLPFDGRGRTHLGNEVFEGPLLESSLELAGAIIHLSFGSSLLGLLKCISFNI